MISKNFLTQTTFFLLFIILSTIVLKEAQDVLLPLTISAIFAFIILPLSNKLESKKCPRWLSTTLGVVFVGSIVGIIIMVLSFQISQFGDDMPMLKGKLNEKALELQQYIKKEWGYTVKEQNTWINKQREASGDNTSSFLMDFFSATTGFIANLTLIPIMVFFMLLYRNRVKTFLMLLDKQHNFNTYALVKQIGKVSQMYLKGLFFDVSILTVLNSIGFLILGVEHAFLFALIAAILNIIPYIGVIIGGLFPMLMVLVTEDNSWLVLGVLGIVILVQFLDNNVIYPKVVGSSVSINPLMSIVALIIGNIVWGTAGMILALPLIGMLKVILDNIKELRPYGYLMGEEKIFDTNPPLLTNETP